MANAFDDLTEIQEVVRTIRARAELIQAAVAQARNSLDGTTYECGAAHRQRAELTRIVSRAQLHGEALTALATDLLRRAANLTQGPV